MLSSPVLLGLFGITQEAAAEEQPDDPQPVAAAKGLIEGELIRQQLIRHVLR